MKLICYLFHKELSIIECCSMLHQAIEKGWNVNQNESCQDKLIQLCMKRITELGLFVESEGVIIYNSTQLLLPMFILY
jgi:hypothetical protein